MRLRKLIGGIGLATILALSFAHGANAQTGPTLYSCNNGPNPPPSNPSGNVQITPDPSEGGNCTLGDVAASGYLTVNASGNVTAGTLSGATYLIVGSGATVSATGLASSGGSINVTSGAVNITVSGAVSASTSIDIEGSGNVTLQDATANGMYISGGVLQINGTLTDTGGIQLLGTTSVSVPGAITTTNNIDVESNSATMVTLGKITAPTGMTALIHSATINLTGPVTSANGPIGLGGSSVTSSSTLSAGTGVQITADSANGAINIAGAITSNTAKSATQDGSIQINGNGTVTTSTVTAETGGNAKRNPSNVSISGAQVTTAKLQAKGAVSVFANTGAVQIAGTITAGQDRPITVSGTDVTVTGKINAPSTTAPIAANVNITGTGTVTLADVDSSGKSADQPGGMIAITANTFTPVSKTISANGFGNGAGGSITLTTTTAADLSKATISAIAGADGNGQGGMFTAPISSGAGGNTTLKVNSRIKVDGGTNVGAAFDGSISLNNVTCQQYLVGAGGASVPKFWGCLNPQSSTAVPAAIAAIPPALQANIQGLSTYVFTTIPNYNSFFSTNGVDVVPAGVLGNTSPVARLNISAVFVNTGSGVDYTPYLTGNMMHEVGHLEDNNNGTPSGSAAFVAAANSTIATMTGTWPNPQSPTCQQVFGAASINCNPQPVVSPWQQFKTLYIQAQNVNKELFAEAFQNCSNTGVAPRNNELYSVSENTAQQSMYMIAVWNYMNTVFWPGGCPAGSQ